MAIPDRTSGPAHAGWEHFPHDADIGIRGIGPDLATAFEQAAVAMTAVITAPERIRPTITVPIRCEGRDPEWLFYDWINALVFEMATRGMLFGRFEVRLTPAGLEAVARGEPVDRERHRPAVEIKGATLTELAVGQDEDGCWFAQCILDV